MDQKPERQRHIASRRRILLGSAAALLAGCWSRRPGSVGSRRLFTLAEYEESFGEWPYDAALSHDGYRYAVIGPGPRIQVCAIEPWRELARIEFEATAINVASLDRDGSRVACSAWRPGGRLPPIVEVWSTATGERIAALRAPGREVVALEFSADNRLLLIVSSGGHVRVWDTQRWRRVAVLRAPADVLMASAISESGDWIVTAERAESGSHVNSWRRADRRWTRIAEQLPGAVRGLTIVGDRLGVAMDAGTRQALRAAACGQPPRACGPSPFPKPVMESSASPARASTPSRSRPTVARRWSSVAWRVRGGVTERGSRSTRVRRAGFRRYQTGRAQP